MAHEFHEHADPEHPVEGDSDASDGVGRSISCEGTTYGDRFCEGICQDYVTIDDTGEKIKSRRSATGTLRSAAASNTTRSRRRMSSRVSFNPPS